MIVIELTQRAGVRLSDEELQLVCTLPRHFINQSRRFGVLAVKSKDAKLFFDKHIPRITRDRSNLRPMEIVAGDVHHCDIQYQREDGSIATPKLIAWVDLATWRAFASVIFLEPGKGIRQEHVIQSFIDMVVAWGIPSGLYLDNGSEYNWTDFIEDALKCASVAGHGLSIKSGTTRARPYNAPAKVIESLFARLERGPFAHIPGYIGGNRMAKKTANIGRDAEVFPGKRDLLQQIVQMAFDYSNQTPFTTGHLKGKTAIRAYDLAIAAGWQRIDIDRYLLEAVFATDYAAKADRGRVRVRGEVYYADGLLPLTGDVVHIRLPKVGDKSRVLVLNRDGSVLCTAQPEHIFEFGDVEGAKEQGRRAKFLNSHLAVMQRDVDRVDLVEGMREFVSLNPTSLIAPSAGKIELSDSLNDQANVLRLALPENSHENKHRDLFERRRRAQQRKEKLA